MKHILCGLGFLFFLLHTSLTEASFRKDFAKGYHAFQKKDYGTAGKILGKIQEDALVVEDYVLYALGTSLVRVKKCAEAVAPLQTLLEKYPTTRWRAAAQESLVQASLCQGDQMTLREALENYLKDAVPAKTKAQVLLDVAEGLLKQGNEHEAEPNLWRLVHTYPSTPAGQEAVTLLEGRGALSRTDWSELADKLLDGGSCEKAQRIYEKLSSQGEHLAALAECYFSGHRYGPAKDLYQKLCRLEQPKLSCLARLAQSAARSDDADVAIAVNEKVIKLFPRSPEAREAPAKIAFLLEDSGRFARAIPLLRGFLKEKERGAGAQKKRERLLERLAWAHYRQNHWQEALEVLEEGSHQYEFNGFFPYWMGRVLEEMGEARQAGLIYDQIIEHFPASYYALRALERRAAGGNRSPYFSAWWLRQGVPVWEQTSVLLADSSTLQKVEFLNSLGFVEDARVELRRLRHECESCQVFDPSLHHRFIKNQGDSFQVPFGEVVFPAARDLSLDPYLIYAMMRQESRFKEKVHSPAGAIGLMQLMPLTAKRVAEHAGWDYFDPEQVDDPEINIRLGMEYFRMLGDYFDDNLLKVASYNAGEEAVKRWLKSRPDLSPEEFIEEIPYGETRDYVKKIYTNWQAYRFIYGK